MIVRITRFLILLQAAAAIGIAILGIKVFHIDRLWLACILGIATVVLFRIAITTNNFCLAWINRSETPPAFRLTLYQTWRLFFEEFGATMYSSSWAMPFRPFIKYTAQNPGTLPVLLVHGYGCNSGYWQGMSKMLMHTQITHRAIDMEPVLDSIDAYVAVVHSAVETLCDETGQDKIIIVGHSMGGLAARAYLRDHGAGRIAKIITLGTPHHGTMLANFGVGINTRQMRWSGTGNDEMLNSWLHKLAKSEDDTVRACIVSIYSHHDNIIAPQTSSFLPGAKNIEFHGIGHVALGLNPAIQTRAIEEIRLASQALMTISKEQSA